MKINRFFSAGAALFLLFGMAGCGSVFSGDSSSAPESRAEQSQAAPQSSTAPSSQESSQPASSGPAAVTGPETQQEAISQARGALSTKVAVMLPSGVPVKAGRYLTAVTTSKAADYTVSFCETDQPAEINSKAAAKGTPVAAVEGTAYKDAAAAQDGIPGYERVDTSVSEGIVNLGHAIKAVADAGAGHQMLTWNEGRWCIRIDSPSDPIYQNKDYPDRERLAKNVVAYLEDHTLPAPQKIGVISIDIWSWNYGATVEWQVDRTVYQVSSGNPMTALAVAVSMKAK